MLLINNFKKINLFKKILLLTKNISNIVNKILVIWIGLLFYKTEGK